MVNKFISLKTTSTKILLVVFISLCMLSAYFIINSYNEQIRNSENLTLEKLKAISNTISLSIKAEDQNYLINKFIYGKSRDSIENDSIYKNIHEYLKKAHLKNNFISSVDIYFYDSLSKSFITICSYKDSTEFGIKYQNYDKIFIENYNIGGVKSQYKDEWGIWLSAFSPILTKDNKSIGIVEVDLRFNDFIQSARSKLYKNLVISILIFLITCSFLLRYIKSIIRVEENTKIEIEVAYKIIHEKNNEVIQSINYAKKIQTSILPNLELIHEYLPKSFILYKPKDIVSGDFYYFHPTNAPNIFYIAAIDCTGHGVPGAFMSMIGNNLLKQIIKDGKVSMPHEILALLNNGIVEILKQEGKINETKDGMDIALCLINKSNNTLYYSGANRPLLYLENNELSIVKPDKKSIGGYSEETKEFTLQQISIVNKRFYISTDGYADQFGGTNSKKLMTKTFHNKIIEINNEKWGIQKNALDNFITEWKNTNEQTDDILVIGFEI